MQRTRSIQRAILLIRPRSRTACVADPIFELLAGDLLHLLTAAADEFQRRIQLSQAAHQRGAVIISADFACDKVDCSHRERTLPSCTRWHPASEGTVRQDAEQSTQGCVCSLLGQSPASGESPRCFYQRDVICCVILTANSSAAVA